ASGTMSGAAGLRPLLETLQDPTAPAGDLTDAHLSLVNRLSGEEGKEFVAGVRKHFPQLCRVFKAHISSENSELSNAALQALGFCVFNSKITSELSAPEVEDLLCTLNSIAVKTSDKNTRTRALWVISKQTFPSEVVKKEVPSLISTLETILTKGDVQSMIVEYEALNVVIRLMEQAPAQMGEEAVRWAKLVIPLVVHSAHKVQLRGATALEIGMPLLLQKQQEVAAVTEHLMTTKLFAELQKLFSSKNETYVLKLWPLFVKLLGKTLHRSGSFINSLLQLEELGFRSGSPVVKKIAFIAWKSLIDNFALNPDILCSAKRLKLLMQPLSSIHVRTEALALTKLEVWWYLLMRLGPQLPANFEQVCIPLIQSTLSLDSSAALQGTPSRVPSNPNLANTQQKPGPYPFASPATPRMNLNSSTAGMVAIPSIQLLGIEMLLHFLMGPEVLDFAKRNELVLSLEPLQHPLIGSPSFFSKHASTFINAVQDGFIAIGKEVPDPMLNHIWRDINGHVKTAIESGNKKEKQGSEVLTMLLQALKNIVRSNSLPVQKVLSLIDTTVKELPPKVLGSPAYQIADMDLLNGTPALFLVQLPFHNNLLEWCVTDERFFIILETLMHYVLSGPTSPLAFSESVLCVINQNARQVENKEHLWRMWSVVVNPLTDWINRTNEVNQGDALEHNFNAVYNALLLPIYHIFPVQEFPQPTMKSLLRAWSDLYRVFARCAALVATAEENLCCEELCAKIISGLEGETPVMSAMLDGLTHVVSVMVDCINFAPYGIKYQPKNRSPQTPTDWSKKKREPLGKLSSLFKLLVMLLDSFHALSSEEICPEQLASIGHSVIAVLHNVISHVSLPSVIGTMFAVFSKPLAVFYEKTKLADVPKAYSNLNSKLEKLLAEIIVCLQSHCTGCYDSELLEQLAPLLCAVFQHKSRHIRKQCASFWNTTFAKAASLTYPEELKPVLSQAKQKMPLLLPGFESIEVAEEQSTPFSDETENSQWDAKLSGMEVNVRQKRDSILAQTSELKNELKEKSDNVQVTSAKLKLEFSASKPKSDVLLEEEKSVDFVFIPPETKARVLTEHQKEVLRSKRIDIPAMYNNLDSSQDTTLFSQYTQSQEDSLEKTSLIENAKEDIKNNPQEENEKSGRSCIADSGGTVEDCKGDNLEDVEGKPAAHLESSSALNSKGESQRDDTNGVTEEESSVGGGLEKSATETASKESSGNENTSNISSSSASSDVISGTPQPTSRRQSFITLEKFDSSESRPFSPSALSSVSEMSRSAPVPDQQGNKNTGKTGHKPGKSEEENKNSSQAEHVSTAKRRGTRRRQSKMEQQGSKQSRLGSNSEQGRSTQESFVSNSMENSAELSCVMEGTERVLTAQHQPACSAEEAEIKKAEGVVTEIEKVRAFEMDSKENTPPKTAVSPERAAGDDSQGQKILRRSSRRRSENAETAAGSQEKEDGCQKKDRRKDYEKALQRKVPQTKEDASQKQKAVCGKASECASKKESSLCERPAAEDVGSKEPPAPKGPDEEGNRSARKSEDALKTDVEGQHRSSDTAAEKKRERPRYHTRSSSQGLLSSIENAEADGSETKKGSLKKKSGKTRNRSDSLEGKWKDIQPGNQSHEVSSQVDESKNLLETNRSELSSEGSTDPALIAAPSDGTNQVLLTDAGKAEGSASSNTSPHAQNVNVEQSEAGMLAQFSSDPQVSEEALKGEENKCSEKQSFVEQHSHLQHECVQGADTSGGDLSSLQMQECQHKRSKRVRKVKSCDCCWKRLKQQSVSLSESKNEGPVELLEPQTTPVPTAVNTSEVSGSSNLEESLSLTPCAMSTPLPPAKESSMLDLERDRKCEDNLEGNPGIKEDDVHTAHTAGEISDSVVEIEEADKNDSAEQHVSVSECALDEPSDSSVAAGDQSGEQAAVEEKSQSGEMEGIPEALVDSSKPETEQVNELESSQDNKEEAEDAQGEVCITPDEEMREELPEAEMTAPENVGNEEAAGNSSTASPQKPEGLDSFSSVNESPNSVQARCTWSPSASPSTSILKRGVKRHQDEDSLSPANKIRRVSFANPIYQEGLADDIDRRSPVIRSHSSPSSRSLKILSNIQTKHITTPTKGFLSPGSRNPKFKSSKKCLITEMVKESLPSPTECVYPALVGCKAPVDVILPQITSNI
ncbi:RIF1 protein, partial [Odontophorus gujanensis]|nr:RIF1 protein [Odontophorus gujanensis]